MVVIQYQSDTKEKTADGVGGFFSGVGGNRIPVLFCLQRGVYDHIPWFGLTEEVAQKGNSYFNGQSFLSLAGAVYDPTSSSQPDTG